MRAKAVWTLAVLCLVAEVALAAPLSSKRMVHEGPLGLAWGKTPADARSMLAGKLTFVEEKPGEEASYHTIEQKWTGTFGGLETDNVRMIFHKGEFLYLAVTLKTDVPGGAVAVFESVVRKMRKVYGEPEGLRKPPRLSSRKAILENVPLENRASVLPMLWNEQSRDDQQSLAALKELQLRIGMWDAFAGWRFKNGVTVQTFIHQTRGEGQPPEAPALLTPIWIFSKNDRFKAWRAAAAKAKVIEPRDF